MRLTGRVNKIQKKNELLITQCLNIIVMITLYFQYVILSKLQKTVMNRLKILYKRIFLIPTVRIIMNRHFS